MSGVPAPASNTDSDGDGQNNAAELAVGTDPSWGLPNPWFGDPGEPALRDMSYYPDHQRVVQELRFSCQSPDGPNAPLDESYLHMSTIG
ncbi:MAG: thrombospondin type 3 repeat-containing protein, partial [Limisphaera sp.]|nr:thrombospondin type 3 repeat-containing protein [Limisphaera sp.]